MPGLVGLWSVDREDGAARFERMVKRTARYPRLAIERESAPQGEWHMGRVHLAHPGNERSPVSSGRDVSALLHGALYDDAALRTSRPGVQGQSVHELVRELYSQKGERFVSELDGAFAVCVADSLRRIVLLAADLFGNVPLYWLTDSRGLIFSSDLSAVIAGMQTAPSIDPRAVADYLTLGAVMEDRTLAQQVRLLEPGTMLRYDAERNQVTIHHYAAVSELFGPKATDKRAYLDDVRTSFQGAVDRCLTDAQPVGLSLSGGLDSRAILSAINGRAKSIQTYTLGVEGCADHLIAEQLSKLAGTRHAFFELDERYLQDFLPNLDEMVSATDGMYLSHGLTEMLALRFIDQLGLKVLLRGHGGELAKAHLAWPLHTDPHVYTFGTLDQLVPYLSKRANYVTPHLPLSDLLTPEAARIAGAGASDSFRSVLKSTTLSPAEGCSYLYLRELNRRFTVPSLELFRTRVDVRMPFVDKRFLQVLLSAPAEWRDSTEVHTALTMAGIPALARVRNSNTGAPANAGHLTEAVLDKFNTLFKRLNVRGYRHYHNFDSWMRRMLLQTVEAELLPSSARIQAFVRQDVLKRVIDETRSGAGDHGYMLQVLLILELWQRQNGAEMKAA